MPKRPSGIVDRAFVRAASGRFAVMSVSMNPGAIALTRIPDGPSSRASVRVRVLTPPFAAL